MPLCEKLIGVMYTSIAEIVSCIILDAFVHVCGAPCVLEHHLNQTATLAEHDTTPTSGGASASLRSAADSVTFGGCAPAHSASASANTSAFRVMRTKVRAPCLNICCTHYSSAFYSCNLFITSFAFT